MDFIEAALWTSAQIKAQKKVGHCKFKNLTENWCHKPQGRMHGTPLCDIPSGCCSFTGPWTVRGQLHVVCFPFDVYAPFQSVVFASAPSLSPFWRRIVSSTIVVLKPNVTGWCGEFSRRAAVIGTMIMAVVVAVDAPCNIPPDEHPSRTGSSTRSIANIGTNDWAACTDAMTTKGRHLLHHYAPGLFPG